MAIRAKDLTKQPGFAAVDGFKFLHRYLIKRNIYTGPRDLHTDVHWVGDRLLYSDRNIVADLDAGENNGGHLVHAADMFRDKLPEGVGPLWRKIPKPERAEQLLRLARHLRGFEMLIGQVVPADEFAKAAEPDKLPRKFDRRYFDEEYGWFDIQKPTAEAFGSEPTGEWSWEISRLYAYDIARALGKGTVAIAIGKAPRENPMLAATDVIRFSWDGGEVVYYTSERGVANAN